MEFDSHLDPYQLLHSETCQYVHFNASQKQAMSLHLSGETSELLFEINYQLDDIERDDCTHSDHIQAYTKMRKISACGQTTNRYRNRCSKVATYPLNGVQGCRIRCTSHAADPFSAVHVVILRWPFYALKLCGVHSCPEY